jgi:hypothetical protein
MRRVRAYDHKGAKRTVTCSEVKHQTLLLVEGVELLHRKAMWERRIRTCDGMETSQAYHKQKLDECIKKLNALRAEGFYIPTTLDEIRPPELRDSLI